MKLSTSFVLFVFFVISVIFEHFVALSIPETGIRT